MSFPLKKMNAARYASLEHPGDAFSFDIFSQAGRAARDGQAARRARAAPRARDRRVAVRDVPRDLRERGRRRGTRLRRLPAPRPRRARRSARRQHRSSAAPGGGAEAVSSGRWSASHVAGSERIRSDVRVPVLTLQSETDVVGLGSAGARQHDAERFRLWEIAGAAHADTYLLVASGTDDGSLPPAELARAARARPTSVFGMKMDEPHERGPAAALRAPGRRSRTSTAGPAAARRRRRRRASSSRGRRRARSRSTRSASRRAASARPGSTRPRPCSRASARAGRSSPSCSAPRAPSTPATLARLYPGGRSDFLARFEKATDEALAARLPARGGRPGDPRAGRSHAVVS